jgi:hypothetical protein
MVMSLKKEHEAMLEIGPDKKITVPIKMEWADGMVGAVPVFDNKKDAVAYAGKKHAVMELAEVGTSIDKGDADGG